MIFWDTSALVPLLVHEPASVEVGALLERDTAILVWWGTPIECRSAVARRERDGTLTPEEGDASLKRLGMLEESWSEILATEVVREHAARLLCIHTLRAADALQIAAALTWAEARPTSHGFATLDRRVRHAARAEGFEMRLEIR